MTVTTEPSRRWVRGTVGDTTIVDSKHPVLVWEQGRPVPHYAFPRDEVRAELLSEAATRSPSKHADATAWYDLTVDGTRIAHAAWGYSDGELADHISFDWHDVEHWYEEEEEILVHPRDTHHRVDPIQSSRHVRVEINGTVVADTHRPILLFETRLPTRYYIPPEDVNFELLTPTDNSTQCPYKGTARYWSFADVANDG